MTNPSGDPVPAISEADATGEVAALYADIRATLGVPVVNLIWRHLAMFPGALPWAWEALKPLYADDTIAAQAAALRAELQVPALAGLSGPTLAAAGLSPDDLSRITMILRSYERSNAMNMVALCALSARLKGQAPTAGEAAAALRAEAAIGGEMPPLLTLDAMAAPVRSLVEDLNRIGGRDEILASMYRHLANWPVYLALVHALIAPYAAEDRLEPVILNVIENGHQRAAGISGGLATPAAMPGDAAQAEMAAALARFTDGPIGKMIAIVPLIRQAMPA
ncbi:MAG: hypothetical protein HOA08_06990 [Rhodospirillaceae bacterium]|jgi:hypothetical protein|nr:hypothetical protein [Rhodospirillaceae bacterium]MBT3493038.1 hypothetical protein [Rhodospirillaceae bacterium]MBT3782235.1 hypothetical protein [Rhodospirillaceae bacterium]MBT3977754.1 hypothetical protein [Rhodospirillaceae bacterium]MBT4168624.1 hypothetical protein [Rhodospirillaceae bacterium]